MPTDYILTGAAQAELSRLIGRQITIREIGHLDIFYSDGAIPNGRYACSIEGCVPYTFYLTREGVPVFSAPKEYYGVAATIQEFFTNAGQ